MWFCEKRELFGKKELLGRNWHIQEVVKSHTADLEAQFAAMEKRLDKKFAKRESDVSILDT